VHFEGRAVGELHAMLKRVAGTRGPLCSLEIEKPRPGIEDLFALPDLLLFGRQYALATGFAEAPELLEVLAPGRAAVCAWGESGAWGRTPEGVLHHAPAWRPQRVVDTLGAGDVFNAAVIDAWAAGRPMSEALSAGCRLAGAKCARRGLSGLRNEEIP
jgi:ketohexokinase